MTTSIPFKHGQIVRDNTGQRLRWCRCCERCHAAFFLCPAFEGALKDAIVKERNAFMNETFREVQLAQNLDDGRTKENAVVDESLRL